MIFDNWADVCLAKKKNVGVTQLAASLWGQPIWMLHLNCAQGFYNVKNESTFMTSKSLSKNISNENKHTWHFKFKFCLGQLKTSVCFHYWDSLMNFLTYSKASRYTALSCTDLAGARFWIGAKKIWDERIYEVETLSSTVFWSPCLHSIK